MSRHPHDCISSCRRLSDGSALTETDRWVNAMVDELAKGVALQDRLPSAVVDWVRAQWDRLTAIAIWIGQATVLAEDFPGPSSSQSGGRLDRLRDNEGRQSMRLAASQAGGEGKPTLVSSPTQRSSRGFGDLTGCARWEALRRRILSKEASRNAVAGDSECS